MVPVVVPSTRTEELKLLPLAVKLEYEL